MEEIVSMSFRKAERSYFSTPSGWRLATYEETRDGLQNIKEHNILEKWDRVRLLDGWILGPGYDFQMGNDFRGCLGYMLLIQIQTHLSGCAYADVSISDKQKEVALFLSADDCNYEVVYWLINSWAKTDSMDLQDVIQGRLPFIYPNTFKKMNAEVGSLARKLGDMGPVSSKLDKRRFSGSDSVKAVLSDMIKIANEAKLEEYDIATFFGVRKRIESCFPSSLEPAWLQEPAAVGDDERSNIADAFWNFLSECFAGTMIEIIATITIAKICDQLNDVCDLETITSSEKNFTFASHILICLSEYRTHIIHAPLAHNCRGSCAGKIISYVASNNEPDDRARLKQTLETNAMWKCYDDIGSYDLLNKLLVVAASGKVSTVKLAQVKGKTHLFVVNKLLECGAQLGPAYAVLSIAKVTALLAAVLDIEDEETEIEVAKSLLNKCDVKKQKEMVDTPTEDGWNSLHIASLAGEANTCQMLLDYGAEPGFLQSEYRKTAFHFAVESGRDAVINLFLKHPSIIDLLESTDKKGESPLDTAVADSNIKLAAQLIAKSKQPEVHFDKVDIKQLLRYSILDGSVQIVEKLLEQGTKLPAGESDEEGKTILHLAAMCEDDDNAREMVKMAVLKSNQGKEKLVAKCDKRGRTALQEAALNGNKELCRYLLDINPEIMSLKDKNGQNPIYDAIKAKKNEVAIIKMLVAAYSMKDTPLNALTDRNGLTSLHIAASLGKKDVVKLLLSSQNSSKQYLKGRYSNTQEASTYLKRSDYLGQTALHKAADNGDYETVKLLLDEGAHPLTERDCDGRTALHYAVQSKTEGDKIKLADCLLKGCKTDEEKLLLLWASAAGLGTADDLLRNNNDDELSKFLVEKKKLGSGNLLRTAASVGDIEMTKELISRGYQLGDIHDTEWTDQLTQQKRDNVNKVSRQLERIVDQVNDQPTVLDNLGRIDYAKGLAALLLNPYIKPPIVVGISGSWGMGKSSLMVQTESILLKTAAQMALLPSTTLSDSASELPEVTVLELSRKGKEKYEAIQKHVDFDNKVNRTLFSAIMDKIWRSPNKNDNTKSQEQIGHTEKDPLRKFLYGYQPKYRKIFKSLAAMDASDMFTINTQRSKSVPQQSAINSPIEETVPAILTVQYNAWKYRNETEALAGMAVEITKELEGIMTEAQWLSCCWRNTWKKRKYHIWIEIIFPCLLAVILACTITWLLWIILDKSDKFRNWVIPKYACLPTAIVVIGWTVTRSAMSILKPVSSQLMSYISFPDHTDKLGYQERVISDINFLKDEIGRKPCMIFKAYSWICTMISTLWFLFFDWWVTPLFFNWRILGKAMLSPKIAPTAGANLRIIVFIDDLDRCQESVILQVLSAINLVLAVCEINVVLGIDKGLIERAIIKKYGDMKNNKSSKDNQELADRYLQKIIQLPLDLPDPSEEQSRKFLEGQLGVFQEPSESSNPELKSNTVMNKIIRQETRMRQETLMAEARTSTESVPEIVPEVAIDVHSRTPVTNDGRTRLILLFFKQIFKLFITFPFICCGKKDETEGTASNAAPPQTGREAQQQGEAAIANHAANIISNQNYWSQIPIRELLFVRYSKGEQDAFCYFQQLATDSRKLPREWKRHLTYHRLVWNIFYLTGEAKDLAGWQVQLITWIFVCWEWRENINIVIQNWKKIGIIETSTSDGPSLQRIVDYFIEVEMGTSHQEETKETILKVSDSRDVNNETESSKREQKKLDEAVEDDIMMEDGGRPPFKEKNKKKNKRRKKKKMEEEMREKSLQGNIDDQQRNKRTGQEKLDSAVIKQIGKLEKMLDELKKEINDLKDEALKKHSRKNEKREEEKKMKLKRWETLRLALGKYDVPMNAIQAFQRFRFYCIAGHLSWPLSQQVQRKKKNDSYED